MRLTDYRNHTHPSLFLASLLDREQKGRLDQQEATHDDAENAYGLGGDGEEDQAEEQIGQGHASVSEGEEARAARVEARRRHELADELKDPPDERDESEEYGDPSDDSDRPEVVRGHLRMRFVLVRLSAT